MISQELRSKWKTIRPAAYNGDMEPCRACGSVPQIYVVDPDGLWLKYVMPDATFFAARCVCGMTGGLESTGKNALGNYVTAQRAAELAARAWNDEQEADHE